MTHGPLTAGNLILLSPSVKTLSSGMIRLAFSSLETLDASSTEAGPANTDIGNKFSQGYRHSHQYLYLLKYQKLRPMIEGYTLDSDRLNIDSQGLHGSCR